MDEKRLEFPCTNKCLVYASCNNLCMIYRDYVEEAYRQQKYRCFKIIPPPPLQIQQLSELMNRVKDDKWLVNYYPAEDMLIIAFEVKEVIATIMGKIRKRKNLHDHPSFPDELK